MREYPACPFLRRLIDAGSDLGAQLGRVLDMPLRRYLASMIPRHEVRANRHRESVAQALVRYLTERGEPDADEVSSHLLSIPVMQLADHSKLLLDAETFLHNYLFYVACREAGVGIMISSQCSTVSCLSRRDPVEGAVFLRTRGDLYKVFPLSKWKLKGSSFCALEGPLTMTFEVLEGPGRAREEDALIRRFVGRSVPNAPEGYRTCNDEIWQSLDLAPEIRRVAVDESMTSEIVALHLQDRSSPIYRLLFEPPIRDSFLLVKRMLVASPKNLAVNRAEPDFLWLRKGTRLYQVVLRGQGLAAELVLEADGSPLPIPYERRAFAQALRDGVLYVDRVLAYVVRCLLPGIVAVGGTSQQGYVALYRQMLLRTQEQTPFLDEADVENVSRPDASRVGGAPLLEITEETRGVLATLGPRTRFAEFEQMFLDRPVGETIGRLDCARYFERALARAERASI